MSDQLPDPYSISSTKPVHPFDRPPAPPPTPAPTPGQPFRPRVEFHQATPILSYVLLGAMVVVFIIDYLTGGMLTQLGAKDNQAILQGQWWRFVTPIFLHAGLLHIGVNGYSLYIVGPYTERSFGRARFAAIFFLTGITASLASFALSSYPSIGASGAIFGVVGAIIPLLYRNRKVLANTRKRIISLVEVIGLNLLIGLMPGIDNWAHLGGLVAGLLLGWVATPLYVVHPQPPDLIRVEDESQPLPVWSMISLYAALLGAAIVGLILLRS